MKETERRFGTVKLITRSPFALVVVVAVSILVIETLIMFILPFFLSDDSACKNIADGLLLTLFLTPVLHYFIYRPFANQIRKFRESEEKLHAITQTATDAIISINGAGEIIYWNKAAEKMFGHAESEALGKPVGLIIPKRYDDAHRQGLARVVGGGAYHLVGKTVTVEGVRKDGAEFPLELSLSAWESGGNRYFTGIIRDITDRKKVEQELLSIIEAQPDILYVINMKGELVKWNSALQKLCGLTPEQMMGRLAAEFVCEADRPVVFEGIKEVFEKGSASIEVRFIRQDGTLVPHLCNGAVWKNLDGEPMGFIGVGKDITKLKAAQDRLIASEQALSNAQKIAHLGNWELDIQTGKTIWSDELRRMYGLAPEEVEPAFDRFMGLVHPEDRKIIEENMHKIKSGEPPPTGFEVRIIRPDGEERDIQGKLEVVTDKGGKPVKLIGINMDITDRKLMEKTLLRQEKLASIGTLSAGVAHEILNPLNIIGTIVQVMQMDEWTEKTKENLGEIMTQISRATKITNNLRMFAHVHKREITPVDVHALFDETATLMEHDLSLDNIMINRDFDQNLPLIFADQDLLAQVFLNLLNNARHAMEGIKDGRKKLITIKTRAVDGTVEIRLFNNGPRIPEDIIGHIFDPFFTTKDPNKGTGLGLSMAHTFIRDFGGTIWAQNQKGEGVTFIITLPAKGKENENTGR